MTTMSTMQASASLRKTKRRLARPAAKRKTPRRIDNHKELTTISLDRETREFLKVLGRMGETYDDVIRRLIRYAPIKEQDKIWNRIHELGKFIPLEEV